MERVLIVNADDFGLSKGQNYGIVEAYRNGVVTSTTALVNGEAIDHAAQLSRELPALGVGMHFVLTLGKPVSEMPGLTRDGLLGKWIWQMAEEDTLPLDEIAHELACQYQRFIDVFGREPTHLDSHHHVHMFPQIFPIVARFAAQRGIALRIDRQTVLNADDLPSDCGEAIIFALIGDATNSSSNQQWRDLRGNLGILHCAEKNDLKMIFLHWILHLNDFRLNRFKSTFNHCPNS